MGLHNFPQFLALLWDQSGCHSLPDFCLCEYWQVATFQHCHSFLRLPTTMFFSSNFLGDWISIWCPAFAASPRVQYPTAILKSSWNFIFRCHRQSWHLTFFLTAAAISLPCFFSLERRFFNLERGIALKLLMNFFSLSILITFYLFSITCVLCFRHFLYIYLDWIHNVEELRTQIIQSQCTHMFCFPIYLLFHWLPTFLTFLERVSYAIHSHLP